MENRRVEDKIDKLIESVAKLQQIDEDQKKNTDKFWGVDWPRVVKQIDSNSVKIAVIEVELAKLKTKVFVWGTVMIMAFTIITQLLPLWISK